MKKIDKAVEMAKKQDEWRREYMTMALELERQWAEGEAKGRAEGRAEGLAEGEARGETKGKLALLKEMVRDGILTIKDAAGRVGLSEESFRKQAML